MNLKLNLMNSINGIALNLNDAISYIKFLPIVVEELVEVLQGTKTNHYFFTYINTGWLEKDYDHCIKSGMNEWEWMFKHSEKILVSAETYDWLMEFYEE